MHYGILQCFMLMPPREGNIQAGSITACGAGTAMCRTGISIFTGISNRYSGLSMLQDFIGLLILILISGSDLFLKPGRMRRVYSMPAVLSSQMLPNEEGIIQEVKMPT